MSKILAVDDERAILDALAQLLARDRDLRLMLSPPRHAGRERLLRASQALAEALRLISDAHDPAAADAVLGVVAEQVDVAAEILALVVHRLQHLEQGQHVVDGANGCSAPCR